MRKKGHLKKKLRKKLRDKFGPLEAGERALVVCVGDKCATFDENRATLAEASAQVASHADAHLRVRCIGCLKVCKKGPIVAILPDASLYRRVRAESVGALFESLLAVPSA